jgi:hypothetical protein
MDDAAAALAATAPVATLWSPSYLESAAFSHEIAQVKTLLVNFASGTSNLLATLVATSARVDSRLKALEGHVGNLRVALVPDAKESDRPSSGTSVSLDFVNELLDTLFVPDAPVRNAAAAAVGPDAQPVVTTTSVVTGDACTHNVAVTGNNIVVDFVVGDTVWLRDLVSKPELNGKEGRILSGPTSTGRYAVHIPPSALFGRAEQNVTVKPQNFTKHLFGGT